MGYHRPADLDEALALLAERSWTVLAGGTDLYPSTIRRELAGDILDIGALEGLRHVTATERHVRIGGRVTWSDLLKADLPPAFDALKLAAREVGGWQIQNAGTIAGNLCNASPAADGAPPLLVLDAAVELASAAGSRILPLAAFIEDVRRTARRPDELLTAVLIPKASMLGRSHFLKLGARRHLVISIAMVAARLLIEDGVVRQAALAVGACSASARRFGPVERRLEGLPAGAGLAATIDEAEVASLLSPIDDIRGSAGYRARAAAELLRRAVLQAAGVSR